MCGRYTLTQPIDFVEEHFRLHRLPPEIIDHYRPRYNVAPGQNVLVIGQRDGDRTAAWHRWGLIPSWARDPAVGYKMINARSETAATKPSFRTAFRRRRWLIPADRFYEWKRVGSAKTPYRFVVKNELAFAFAGL